MRPINRQKIIFVAFVVFVLAALIVGNATQSMAQSTGGWTSTNIGGGGAFNHIGAGPTGIIVVGSDLSGAYLSRNRGAQWEPIGAAQGLYSTHVSSVAFDPTSGNILYLGTDDGLYRSANGGNSFNRVLNSGYIGNMAIAPSNATIGYAAHHQAKIEDIDGDGKEDFYYTNGQLYKSTNRGTTWQKVNTNLPNGLHILKIAVNPQNENELYLLCGIGRFNPIAASLLYHSTDGGVTWQRLATNLGDDIMDIAIDPTTPSTLYVTTYDNTDKAVENARADNFYKSTNNGSTWTKLANRSGSLWVDQRNSNTIRLIDFRIQYSWDNRSGIWESTNGGQNWQQVSSVDNWDGGWSPIYWRFGGSFDGEAKTLGLDLSDPDAMFWANSQFIYGTFNKGRSVSALHTKKVAGKWQSTGVDNVVPLDIAISPVDANKIYVGLMDVGCLRSLNGGTSWETCNQKGYTGNWETSGGNTWTIVADPTRANVVWASAIDQDSAERAYLLKSTNSGTTGSWKNVSRGLPKTKEILGLSVDPTSPTNSRTLFVTAAGDVYRSTNDGANWGDKFPCNGCRFTAVDAFDGDLVYAGGENGLFRSTNGGTSWQAVDHAAFRGSGSGLPGDWSWQGVFAIEPDPNTSGVVYVAAKGNGKGLYRSRDRGATWQKLLNDDFLRGVAVTPGNGNVIYATSSSAFWAGGYESGAHGALRSTDGGATWSQVNDGLAWPLVLPIAINPSDPAEVWIGAAGEGFHTQRFTNGNPPTPIPTQTPPPTTTPPPATPPPATPPPTAGNLLRNGDFQQGENNWTVWGNLGHTTEGTTDRELCLTFPARLPNLWDAGVDQYGVPIKTGSRYQLKFDAWSAKSAKIMPIVGEAETPWAVYWSQKVSLRARRWQTYSYEFTMSDATDLQAGFFLHVGGHRSPEICLDDISLTEVVPGAIRGQVTDEAGVPLDKAKVTLYYQNGTKWKTAVRLTTDAAGRYEAPDLAAGNYRIRVTRSKYVSEYYQDQRKLTAADILVLNPGSTLDGVNIQLAAKGRATLNEEAQTVELRYQLRDATTSQPVEDAIVTLYTLPDWQLRTATEEQGEEQSEEQCDTISTKPADLPWTQFVDEDEGEWVDEELADGQSTWLLAAGCYFTRIDAEGYQLQVTPVLGYDGTPLDLTINLLPTEEPASTIFVPLVQR